MNYLLKRGTNYYYQRRIPRNVEYSDCLELLNHKTIFQKSLRTSSLRKAKFEATKLNVWFESLLEESVSGQFDAGQYYSRLIAQKGIDPNEARGFTLERIEENTKCSFDWEPGQAVPKFSEQTARELQKLKDAEKGKPSLSLIRMADECVADLKADGRTNRKSIPGKIKPAARWLLKCNDEVDLDLLSIKPSMVHRAMKFSMRELNLTASTVNSHINALRTLWKFARFNYDIEASNPFAEARVKGKVKSYQRFLPQEISELYKAAHPSIRLAIKIGATTGARISEVVTMKAIEDADTGDLYWSIRPNGDGKTANSTRVIPVHPRLLSEVSEGFQLGISDRQLSRLMKKVIEELKQLDLFDRSGSGKLSFHSFRAHVASELLYTHGYKPEEVELFTGHRPQGSDIKKKSTVHTYIQCPSKDILKKMASELCWPFEN